MRWLVRVKKSAAFAAALNPPKEEGGGVKLWSASIALTTVGIMSRGFGAMQEDFACRIAISLL
jgi:hypothetical protein